MTNATAAASNASHQSDSSPFDAILAALGIGNDNTPPPTTPAVSPQPVVSAGSKPGSTAALTARTQKLLGHKSLDSLKVLTQSQAAQLAAQAQATQAPSAQTALSASLAANPQAASSNASVLSSVGNAASTVVGAIESGISAVVNLVDGGGSSASSAPPIVPAVAGPSNVAASKTQAQSAAATIAQANSEALDVALQAAGAQGTTQEGAQAATALAGARISAAKNPTADQLAASKQQAFANLKPAGDVKATETQALQPNAGTDKADSKDGSASGGDSGDKNSSSGNPQTQAQTQTASNPTIQTPDQQQQQQNFQPAATALPDSAAVSSIAGGTAATASTNAASSHAPGSLGIAVGPQSPSQSAQMPATLNALAVSIAAKSIEGAKQFNIRLDPAELGRVDVKLSVDNTGKAQAHLSVEKPQTLDMLQKDSGSLQRSLKESGVDLSNNGLQFSLKNQQQSASQHSPTAQGRRLSVTAAPVVAQTTSTYSLAHDRSRLDIRV